MKIKYNAPTTLTFAFFCTLVVALDQSFLHGLTRAFFTVPNALAFDLLKPLNYLRLFTHIAGHADWNHLISNLAYILLLGPMLEETYGSVTMFLMIIVTGFVTGVLNACFFPNPLLGASGVVFMMILLASFTNHGKDDVPLTFILIVILYLGREVLNAFKVDDISQFAHLAGGLCGSLFGFFSPVQGNSAREIAKPKRITAERITVARKPGVRSATEATLARAAASTPSGNQKSGSGTISRGSATARSSENPNSPRSSGPARSTGATRASPGTASGPARPTTAPKTSSPSGSSGTRKR